MKRNLVGPRIAITVRSGGFTLVELLVAMTLLSVIMIALLSALRTMAQTESRIDQRLARLDQTRVAQSFLQQTLGRISATVFDVPDVPGKKAVPFKATPDGVTWVGILPARPNLGGRYFFKLSVDDAEGDSSLVLRFSPWRADIIEPDWSAADARVLLEGIESLSVESQGAPMDARSTPPNWPQGWTAGWPVADALPERVRLTLRRPDGELPSWVIPLRPLLQTTPAISKVVVGGT